MALHRCTERDAPKASRAGIADKSQQLLKTTPHGLSPPERTRIGFSSQIPHLTKLSAGQKHRLLAQLESEAR